MDEPYLSHHGILGQKWGVRRFQNVDRTWTAAGKERYGNPKANHKSHQIKNDTIYGAAQKVIAKNANVKLTEIDHQQEGDTKVNLAKLGLNVALDIITLNPVGAAIDAGKVVGAATANVKAKKAERRKEKSEIDPETGLHLKNKETSADEDVKMVNPGYRNFNTNTKNNCVLCSTAMELRRRGYEVTAGKAARGYTEAEYTKFFKGAKEENYRRDTKTQATGTDIMFSHKTGQAINDWAEPRILKQGDGARGYLNVRWGMGGGHSMTYEVQNGKVVVYDAQSGKKKSLRSIANASVDMGFVRLDDKEPNWNEIKKAGAVN